MPLILNEDMTDEEILQAIAQTYGEPSNWEPYEKDYGVGRPIMRPAWTFRDKGEYARRGLEIIEARKSQ